jgi:CRISPR-associated protein Cmr5
VIIFRRCYKSAATKQPARACVKFAYPEETQMSSLPTLDQRRSKHAWEAVTSFAKIAANGKRTYGEDAKEYAREAKKLPARIITAGLGPSLAFIKSKAKEKKPNLNRLHDHLTNWVLVKCPVPGKVPDSLLLSIIEGDSDFLRRATAESLAYLQWLVRFADAEGLTEGE